MKLRLAYDRRHAWLLLALPAFWQLALLLYAVAVRWLYPYDLEWMEGGMLAHAYRYDQGQDIYAPPSVDFIPQLYTPLYPALLALLGKVFGLGYGLGRAVSILSLLAVLLLAVRAVAREAGPEERPLGWLGAALAAGFVAAAYPFLACFYDLVRVDMFFMALGLGGLYALRAWAPTPGPALWGLWHPRVAAAAAILAVSFFAKQTGVLLVVAGGAALLVMNWRAAPIYGLVAGVIGGGGTWIYNRASGGWFWKYIYDVHQQHDTNKDRFWASFGNILLHFPALTAVVLLGLIVVAAHAVTRRRLPPGAAGFLYWAWMFACGTVIGAVGWATQWAIFNAYLPAMIFGAIAAGAAVAPLAACAAELPGGKPAAARTAAAVVIGLMLAAQLVDKRWMPTVPDDEQWGRIRGGDLDYEHVWLPSKKDREAGDDLMGRLRELTADGGQVFYPSHPWYPILAGQKRAYVHRIGIKDVTAVAPFVYNPKQPKRKPKPALVASPHKIVDLIESLKEQRFTAVVLDAGEPPSDYPGLTGSYRVDGSLAGKGAPRTYYGKPTWPGAVYRVVVREKLPAGHTAIHDFEAGRLDGWKRDGLAWGYAPEQRVLAGGREVTGFGGRWFASSMHGGDLAVGTITSAPFLLRPVDSARLALQVKIGGGKDTAKLRVELRLPGSDVVLRSATGPGSEAMTVVDWDVTELAGKRVYLILADEATDGHLVVDDIREIVR